MIKLVQITKDERFYLESQGFKMHKHIVSTNTRHKRYFAVTYKEIMKCLEEYRNKRHVFSR